MTILVENPRFHREVLKRVEGRIVRSSYRKKPYDKGGCPQGYDESIYGYVDGKYLHLAFSPRSSRRSRSVFTTHLADFENFRHSDQWFRAVCGDYTEELYSSQLNRFDLCVDLAIPFDTIHECLSQPKITKRDKFDSRSDEQSLYFGANPKRTIAYERRVPASHLDWIPDETMLKKDKYGESPCVRVEVRTWHNKRYIETLSDIPKLRRQNPFSHLLIERMDEAIIAEVPQRKRHSLWAYKYRCTQVGAQKARMEFNKNSSGNFAKVIGRYLRPLNLDLGVAWENRCGRFFGDTP